MFTHSCDNDNIKKINIIIEYEVKMNKLIFMTALIFGSVYFYKYQLEKRKYQNHIVDIESLEDVIEAR